MLEHSTHKIPPNTSLHMHAGMLCDPLPVEAHFVELHFAASTRVAAERHQLDVLGNFPRHAAVVLLLQRPKRITSSCVDFGLFV